MAAALIIVAGGAVAFAGQSLNRGTSQSSPSSPPPPPPTLLAPKAALTSSAHMDLTAMAPVGLRRDQSYVVRVYVNGDRQVQLDLPKGDRFAIPNVPLAEGLNSIRASLVGSGAEGSLSSAISITLDDQPPDIRILQPTDTIYVGHTTLLGRTEPGADIDITVAGGHDLSAVIAADGRFSAGLDLTMGDNPLVLRSTDAAGNRSVSRISIVRAPSLAGIDLVVTPEIVWSSGLPQTIELAATVRDELGKPVDAAQVTFGVSPPERATTTYQATTQGGRARFDGLELDPGEASGEWLVTVLAVLPSGLELRDDGSFSLQPGAAPH